MCVCVRVPQFTELSPHNEMKLLILLVLFLTLSATSCQVCTTTTTCDYDQHPSPTAARDVIRRGKSGPRGEKGERGPAGAKGSDHGDAVSQNSAVLAEHGGEIAMMSGKIENQNEVIARHEETIRNLSEVVQGQAAKILHMSDVIEKTFSLFYKSVYVNFLIYFLDRVIYLVISERIICKVKVIKTQQQEELVKLKIKVVLTILGCELPVLEGAKNNISSVIAAPNTVVEYSCINLSYEQEGDTLRKCRIGVLTPSFDTNAFSCTSNSLILFFCFLI